MERVGYFFALNTFTQNILNFSVDKYLLWISDYCPKHTAIVMNLGRLEVIQAPKNDLRNIQEIYIWDRKSRDRYLGGLKSHKNTGRINKLVSDTDRKPCKIVKEIDEILSCNTHSCGIKKGKTKNKNAQQSPPWASAMS